MILKLNFRQKEALQAYAKFADGDYRYPYQVSPMQRASTCHALARRGLLDCRYEDIWDWAKFRITQDGRAHAQ